MQKELLKELLLYIRPPGFGVYTVSTGGQEQVNAFQKYTGQTSWEDWDEFVKTIFKAKNSPKKILLGIPADCGAGIQKGAAQGPLGVRSKLNFADFADIGDIICVPHFIEDSMLSKNQIQLSQTSLYGKLMKGKSMPVSPLSITERVCELIFLLSPQTKIHFIGGDHSISFAPLKFLIGQMNEKEKSEFGILHFDAHTDLMKERLGVQYCFATWAFHINTLLNQKNHLLQIGIRASSKPKNYWENHCLVKQIWASEALALGAKKCAEKIIKHFQSCGIKKIYVTNDIDATDLKWASACGTPEKNGLTPEIIIMILKHLKKNRIEIIGADVVEVAPKLASAVAANLTCKTAADYIKAQWECM